MGAGRFRMAILAADLHAESLRGQVDLRDQRRRRADQQVDFAVERLRTLPRSRANSASEARRPFIFQLPATSGRFFMIGSASDERPRLADGPRQRQFPIKIRSHKAIDSVRRRLRYCLIDTRPPGTGAAPRPDPSFRRQDDMLRALRKAAGTWVGKGICHAGLLIVSFAIWGIAGRFPRLRPVDAAQGRRAPKSAIEALPADLNDRLQQIGRAVRPRLTREQARALGIDRQVLPQLVAGAVLDEQTRKHAAWRLSDAEVAQLDHQGSRISGPERRVRPAALRRVIRQFGMTEQRYRRRAAQQIAAPADRRGDLPRASKLPKTLVEAFCSIRGEDRTVDYVGSRGAGRPIEEPSQAVLQDLVRGAQGAIPRAGIPQDRLHQADPEDARQDHRRSATSRRKKDYDERTRALHDAGNAARSSSSSSRRRRSARRRAIASRTARPSTTSSRSGTRWPATSSSALQPRTQPRSGDRRRRLRAPANEVSEAVAGPLRRGARRVTRDRAGSRSRFEPKCSRDRRRRSRRSERARSFAAATTRSRTRAPAARRSPRPRPSSSSRSSPIEAVDRTGARPDGTIVNDLPQGMDLRRSGLRHRGRHREHPVQHRPTGYVFYEVAGHHPLARPHARRGAGQGRRRLEGGRDRTSGSTPRPTNSRKRLKDGATLDAHRRRAQAREADQARR